MMMVFGVGFDFFSGWDLGIKAVNGRVFQSIFTSRDRDWRFVASPLPSLPSPTRQKRKKRIWNYSKTLIKRTPSIKQTSARVPTGFSSHVYCRTNLQYSQSAPLYSVSGHEIQNEPILTRETCIKGTLLLECCVTTVYF